MAVTIDGGYPLTGSGKQTATTTFTIGGVGDGTAGKVFVVTIAVNTYDNDVGPVTLAGGGLTWTRIVGQAQTGTYPNHSYSAVFYAYDSAGALNSSTLTATVANSADFGYGISVYRLTSASSTQTTGATVSVSSGDSSQNGYQSITANFDGSILLWALGFYQGPEVVDPRTNNTFGGSYNLITESPHAVTGKYDTTTTASNSYSLGSSGVVNYADFAAAEIVEGSSASTAFQQQGFQSDAFSIYGGTTGAAGPSGSENDSTLTTDAYAPSKGGISGSESDSALTSDSYARGVGIAASESESALTSDTEAYALRVDKTESESALTTDAYAPAKGGINVSENDSTLTSDSYSPAKVGISGSEAESALTTDTYQQQTVIAVSQAETVLTSDTQDAAVSGGGTISVDQIDTELTADTYAPAKGGISGSESDSALTSDSYAPAKGGISGSESDAALTADSYAPSKVGISGSESESALTADSYQQQTVIAVSQAETVLTADTYAPARGGINGSESDTTLTSDAYALAKSGITISLDGSYPVVGGNTFSSQSTTTITGVGDGTAGRLYVLAFFANSDTAVLAPLSVSHGTAWTTLKETPLTGTYANWETAGIYYFYDSSGSLNGSTVTVTYANSNSGMYSYSLYRFSGAASSQNSSYTAGYTNGDSSGNVYTSITAAQTGSYLICSCGEGATNASASPVSNNIQDNQQNQTQGGTNSTSGQLRYDTTTTASSSYTLGFNNSKAYCTVSIAEIIALAETAEADSSLTSDSYAPAKGGISVSESDDTLTADAYSPAKGGISGSESDTALTTDAYAPAKGGISGSESDTALTSDAYALAAYQSASIAEACLTIDAYAAVVAGGGVVTGSENDAALTLDQYAGATVIAKSQAETALTLDTYAGQVYTGTVTGSENDATLTADAYAVLKSGGGGAITYRFWVWNGAAWV